MDSFALSDSGQVVLQSPDQTSAPGTSIDGGTGAGGATQGVGVSSGGTDWGGIASMSARTLDAMNKLVGGALKPYVDRMEKQQYYSGMAQVVQGKALQDIERDDPWYMNITGPSATVRGAQAMTATTALQQAETDFMGQMPDLRTQSPEAVRQYLVNQATNIGNTGDPLVDTMVQSKLAESWGPMLKTHMREHLAWQQEDMFKKQVNLNITNGNSMRAQRQATQTTGWDLEDRAAAASKAVDDLSPMPGQSPESWQKSAAESLRSNLDAGNFDYYEAIKGSPIWSQIDPKVREHLDANFHSYVMKDAQSSPAVTQLVTNTGGFEFQLKHGMSSISSEPELDKWIDGYNDQYSKKTGADYYDNAKRKQLHEDWMSGLLARQKAEAGLENKQAQYQASKDYVQTAFTTGNWNSTKGKTLDPTAIADGMDELFQKAVVGPGATEQTRQNYFARASQASYNEQLRSPMFTQALVSGVDGVLSGGGALTGTQQQAYQWATALYQQGQGPEGLTNYLGADKAAKVMTLINSGVDPADPKAMEEQRDRLRRGGLAVASDAEKKLVAQTVDKADPSWLKTVIPFVGGPGELSPYNLTPEAKTVIASRIQGPAAQMIRMGLPADQAARIALTEAAQHSDFVGGAVIFRSYDTHDDRSLSSAVNALTKGKGTQSNENYQEAVRTVLNNQLIAGVKKAGGDVAHFDPSDWVVRTGTQLGGGAINVQLYPKDTSKGTSVKTLTLNPTDVAAEIYRAETERIRQQKAGPDPQQTSLQMEAMSFSP